MTANDSTSTSPVEPELLNLLLEQAVDHALVLLDTDGKIIEWLAGAEKIFGYKREEVLGRPHAILFTPEDVAQKVALGEVKIASSGTAAEDDRWMLRRDGIRFWATGVMQVIVNGDGQIVGYGKVLQNRTDLRGQIEALENRIVEAEASERRKDDFVGMLAHELRNPLQALTTADALLKPLAGLNDNADFALKMIRRQVDSMTHMIDDLLDMTRLRTGKFSVDLVDQDLAKILAGAADVCQPKFDAKKQTFRLVIASSSVVVRADAPRLQQVFVNLLDNASKYTPQGGNIWAKLFLEDRNAVVKVEDDGIGIDPKVLPRIFDLFAQAESGRRGGLGIGLALVKEITDLHGGAMQVRSDGLGRGSDFVVRLPLAPGADQRPDSPA